MKKKGSKGSKLSLVHSNGNTASNIGSGIWGRPDKSKGKTASKSIPKRRAEKEKNR